MSRFQAFGISMKDAKTTVLADEAGCEQNKTLDISNYDLFQKISQSSRWRRCFIPPSALIVMLSTFTINSQSNVSPGPLLRGNQHLADFLYELMAVGWDAEQYFIKLHSVKYKQNIKSVDCSTIVVCRITISIVNKSFKISLFKWFIATKSA